MDKREPIISSPEREKGSYAHLLPSVLPKKRKEGGPVGRKNVVFPLIFRGKRGDRKRVLCPRGEKKGLMGGEGGRDAGEHYISYLILVMGKGRRRVKVLRLLSSRQEEKKKFLEKKRCSARNAFPLRVGEERKGGSRLRSFFSLVKEGRKSQLLREKATTSMTRLSWKKKEWVTLILTFRGCWEKNQGNRRNPTFPWREGGRFSR